MVPHLSVQNLTHLKIVFKLTNSTLRFHPTGLLGYPVSIIMGLISPFPLGHNHGPTALSTAKIAPGLGFYWLPWRYFFSFKSRVSAFPGLAGLEILLALGANLPECGVCPASLRSWALPRDMVTWWYTCSFYLWEYTSSPWPRLRIQKYLLLFSLSSIPHWITQIFGFSRSQMLLLSKFCFRAHKWPKTSILKTQLSAWDRGLNKTGRKTHKYFNFLSLSSFSISTYSDRKSHPFPCPPRGWDSGSCVEASCPGEDLLHKNQSLLMEDSLFLDSPGQADECRYLMKFSLQQTHFLWTFPLKRALLSTGPSLTNHPTLMYPPTQIRR